MSSKYYHFNRNSNIISGIHLLGTKNNEKTRYMYAQELLEQTNAKKDQESIKKIREDNEKLSSVIFYKKKLENVYIIIYRMT